MNRMDLKKRLDMLVEGNVISHHASNLTIDAFQHLINELNVEAIKQAEMLYTHLPTALTRIENNEKLTGPDAIITNEVTRSVHYPTARKQVAYIEKQWGEPLPQEERDFLYLHYTNVIQINLGGE